MQTILGSELAIVHEKGVNLFCHFSSSMHAVDFYICYTPMLPIGAHALGVGGEGRGCTYILNPGEVLGWQFVSKPTHTRLVDRMTPFDLGFEHLTSSASPRRS